MTVRAHRIVAAGALAVAAVAAPIAVALTNADVTESAGPCLAWYGNREDGVCLSYSNGAPVNVGTPASIYGPGYNGGVGVSTGPLLPGQSWTR